MQASEPRNCFLETGLFFSFIVSRFLKNRVALQPSSNIEYWIPKINRNVERDEQNHEKLIDMGWKVLIIWECELKKNVREKRLTKLCDEIIS